MEVAKNALLGQTRSTSLLVLPILLLIRWVCAHLSYVLDVFYLCSAAASKSKEMHVLCLQTRKVSLYMRKTQNNSLTISINKDNSANRCTTYLFVTLAPPTGG